MYILGIESEAFNRFSKETNVKQKVNCYCEMLDFNLPVKINISFCKSFQLSLINMSTIFISVPIISSENTFIILRFEVAALSRRVKFLVRLKNNFHSETNVSGS